MTNLVLIHGRSHQFKNPGEIQLEWDSALRWGLERVKASNLNISTSVAFYGDLWLADADDELESFKGTNHLASNIEFDLAREILEITDPENDDDEDSLESYQAGLREKVVGWVGLIEKALPDAVTQKILEAFITDVGQYFKDNNLRHQVLHRVASKIRDIGEPVTLICHSLGTIVAYDVLINNPDIPVQHLISLASPLGFKTIHKRITSNGQKGFPPQLRRWVNIYNLEDVICAVRELAPLYPAQDTRQVEDLDMGEGDRPGLFRPFAAHNVAVYLHSKAVAQSIEVLL